MPENDSAAIFEIQEREQSIRFPNLLRLNAEEKRSARQQIEKFGGLVRVMVHPYFDLWDKDGYKIEDYVKPLQKLLCSQSVKKPPLIFFEEGGAAYREIQKVLGKLDPRATENGIYLVPTYMANPVPNVSYSGVARLHPDNEDVNWENLRGVMQRLGVKKVLVGGEYLQVYSKSNWDGGSFARQLQARGNDYLNDKTLGNCVGVTVFELAKKFEVEVSSIAFPHRRARAYGKAFGPVNAILENWK